MLDHFNFQRNSTLSLSKVPRHKIKKAMDTESGQKVILSIYY